MPTTVERLQGRAVRRLLSLPEPVVRRMAGPPRLYRGAALDPRVQLALRLRELARRPSLETLPPARARQEQRVLAGVLDLPRAPLHEVSDDRIAGVPVRFFRPEPGAQPALLYLHGGGFVIGDLDSYDAVCRHLAKVSRCTVVAAEYRLAPEHPFPAAVEDAFAVYEALAKGGAAYGVDPARLAVGGDSAGGNLSAVVAQLARDRGLSPLLQLLIYPSTDSRGGTRSREELAEGYVLTRAMMRWFHAQYAGQPEDPRTSPALGRLDGLCPAVVITCGFDPLRDEGEAYAAKLLAAGVRAQHRCYATMIHGAISMAGFVPAARAILDELALDLLNAARAPRSA